MTKTSDIGVDRRQLQTLATEPVSFHGSRYIIEICTLDQDTLRLEVEQEADASRWRGEFTSAYINEITTKTGNFKPYPVFLKMLLGAIHKNSESVCVDLLTYSDLEVLKAKRLRRAGHDVPMPVSSAAANTKRYLILTYQGEFDKVHYPLPLAYDEYPDPGVLKRTIANLRGHLRHVESSMPPDLSEDLAALRAEKEDLAQRLSAAEAVAAASVATGAVNRAAEAAVEEAEDLAAANAELEEQLRATEAALEEERMAARRGARARAQEAKEEGEELARAHAQIRELRVKNRHLTAELAMHKRKQQEFEGHRYVRTERPSRPRMPSGPSSTSGRRNVGNASAASRSVSPYAGAASDRSRPGSGRSSVVSDTSSRGTNRRPRSTSSAPAGRAPRFNPTAYIQAQREKANASVRSRSTFSPASARPPPAMQSARTQDLVARRRSASVDSVHRTSCPPTRTFPGKARGTGADSRQRGAQIVRPGRSSSPALCRAGGDGAAPRTHTQGRIAVAAKSGRGDLRHGRFHDRGSGSPARQVRAVSPGVALDQVKETLAAYKSRAGGAPRARGAPYKQQPEDTSSEDAQIGALRPAWQPPRDGDRPLEEQNGTGSSVVFRHKVYDDASTDIADIDQRLQALQDFLKSAKASTRKQGGER